MEPWPKNVFTSWQLGMLGAFSTAWFLYQGIRIGWEMLVATLFGEWHSPMVSPVLSLSGVALLLIHIGFVLASNGEPYRSLVVRGVKYVGWITVEKRWRKNRDSLVQVIQEQEKQKGWEMSEQEVAFLETQLAENLPGPWHTAVVFLETVKYFALLFFLMPLVLIVALIFAEKGAAFWLWVFGIG